MASQQEISSVRKRLTQAKAVTVLTGAGVSADSGVPTFRGSGQASGSASDWPGRGGIGGATAPHGPPHIEAGLWRNFRAEELATPEAFSRDPRLVWEWYNYRRELIATKLPNPAHYAFVTLEERIPTFTLITQNVDGLHVRAGSRKLIEIHGNIWKVRCTDCGKVSVNTDIPIPILPYCSSCGGLLRPKVVWFGEALDPTDIQQSVEALKTCEMMLVIGTSGAVQPAASFADIAKTAGAYVAEVNLNPVSTTGSVDAHLQGRAAEILPQLL